MKLQKDYGFVRGFCHSYNEQQDVMEKYLRYAQRLQLNSSRIWLSYKSYIKDPKGYISIVRNYIRTAWRFGISTMPIIFNGNNIDISIIEDDWRRTGEKYAVDIVGALKDEEGIIMWDIMNEPSCNMYCCDNYTDSREEYYKKMWGFVQHFCEKVKIFDNDTPITIGHTYAIDIEPTAEYVDILSFHDYRETRAIINNNYDIAQEMGKKYRKPVINSELCCLARANPYDVALEICQQRGLGWYMYNLIIGPVVGDEHGVLYPDGTTRDPATVAALLGFHRNRNSDTIMRTNINREGAAARAIKQLEEALFEEPRAFFFNPANPQKILEAAEYIINLLEAAEMVPMMYPPSVQLMSYRADPNPDLDEIKKWAYDLALTLKHGCRII